MKILGIVGSPRKGGNTEIMVREALTAARELGAETELVTIADKKISGCDGCGACYGNGVCRIKDDMQPIYQQLLDADGIIIGTPVYYGNVTAQVKAVMDRTHAFREGRKLAGKAAGPIIVARRVGAGQVRALLYTYLLSQGMIAVRAGIGYGMDKGDIKNGVGGVQGLTALQEARTVGENVTRLAKQLARGKE